MPAGDTYTILTENRKSGPVITLRLKAKADGGFEIIAEIIPHLSKGDEIQIVSSIDHWQAKHLANWLKTCHTKTEQ